MANRRMLNCGISLNEKFGSLSIHARLLFIGMITTADDEGRLKGSSLYLKAKVFPYDNFTTVQVTDWKNEISQSNLATHYTVNDIEYFYLNGWYEHQSIRADRRTPTTIPEPPNVNLMSDKCQPIDNQVSDKCHTNATPSIVKVSLGKLSQGKGSVRATKQTKKEYGQFLNILLTDEEHEKLKEKFNSHLPDLIETMSCGIESKGYKYKSHYAALLNWAKRDEKEGVKNGRNQSSNRELPATYTDPEDIRREYRMAHGLPADGSKRTS